MLLAERAQQLEQHLVRRLETQVEAHALEQHVFQLQDRVAPAPILLILLIDQLRRVFLRDAHARHDQLLHLPTILFHLRRQEQARRSNAVVVHGGPAGGFVLEHAVAHEEAVQVHGGGGERDLREFKHDADLEDEVNAFGARFAFFGGGEAGQDGGRAEELVFREKPLRFGEEEELVGEGERA